MNPNKGMPLSIEVMKVGTEAQAVLAVVKKWMTNNFDNRLPCVVEAVDYDANTVVVRPLVMMVNTLEEGISRGEKHNIQVKTIGTGRAFMKFKVEIGDFGWIESSDRNYDLVIQAIKSGQEITEQKPANGILFDWTSATFTADYMKPYNFTGDMYLGNSSGSVSMIYDGDTIALKAGSGGAAGVARLGDEVTTVFAVGVFGTDTDGKSIPSTETTVKGIITAASTTITAN